MDQTQKWIVKLKNRNSVIILRDIKIRLKGSQTRFQKQKLNLSNLFQESHINKFSVELLWSVLYFSNIKHYRYKNYHDRIHLKIKNNFWSPDSIQEKKKHSITFFSYFINIILPFLLFLYLKCTKDQKENCLKIKHPSCVKFAFTQKQIIILQCVQLLEDISFQPILLWFKILRQK